MPGKVDALMAGLEPGEDLRAAIGRMEAIKREAGGSTEDAPKVGEPGHKEAQDFIPRAVGIEDDALALRKLAYQAVDRWLASYKDRLMNPQTALPGLWFDGVLLGVLFEQERRKTNGKET